MKEFKGTSGDFSYSMRESTGITTSEVCADIKSTSSPCTLVYLQSFHGDPELSKEKTIANARLFAAAPKLLKALTLTMNDIGFWLSTQNPELKQKIESAINEALGEE